MHKHSGNSSLDNDAGDYDPASLDFPQAEVEEDQMSRPMSNTEDRQTALAYTYYIDSRFAWIPTYCQGTLCWLQRVWFTWPEINGRPVMASDVLSKADMASMNNRDQQMYLTEYPYDPRKADASKAGHNG